MLKNSVNQFGLVAILLHWITAVVVLGLFAVGWWMVELNYYSEWYRIAPHWHKSTGLLLAGVVVLRLIWKLVNAKPKALGQPWEQKAASVAHALLYILMLAIFCSGYLISTADGRGIDIFDWVTVPSMGQLFEDQEDIAGLVHEYLAYGLIGLVLLHALAALKHHFVDKDETLRRMTRLKQL